MIRHKDTTENGIASRQIVMKNVNNKGWFMFVRSSLYLYNLQSIFQLLHQLRSNCEADQRLCFRYSDSTNPLLLKSEISSFLLFSVLVQVGLCRTCSETTLLVFPRGGSIIFHRDTEQPLINIKWIQPADYVQYLQRLGSILLVNVLFSTQKDQLSI